MTEGEVKYFQQLLSSNTMLLDLLYSVYITSTFRDDEVKERVEKVLREEEYLP